jgi:hypothetical protein
MKCDDINVITLGANSKMSHPYFGQVWGWSLTLGKVGIWSPPGLPSVQSSTARGKTSRIGVFLVSLERSWNVDIENALALAVRTSAAQVMGKRRVGNRHLPDVQFECATWHWKDLDKGYNFGSDLVAIQLCSRELWPFKVPGVLSGQFRDSISGVPGICAIWISLHGELQRIL